MTNKKNKMKQIESIYNDTLNNIIINFKFYVSNKEKRTPKKWAVRYAELFTTVENWINDICNFYEEGEFKEYYNITEVYTVFKELKEIEEKYNIPSKFDTTDLLVLISEFKEEGLNNE